MNFKSIGLILLLGVSLNTFAQLKLPTLISDHMVLQRNSDVKIWGWDNPKQKIKLTSTWSKKKYKIKANENGYWEATIETPDAGGPYELIIKGSETIKLNDVLSGEVWVASGQSNMEWDAERGYNNSAVEVKNANYPEIRLLDVQNKTSLKEESDVVGKWQRCSPESVFSFSAVGYFFARELHNELNIPIGIIGSEWGGTPSEAWTEAEYLMRKKEFKENNELYKKGLVGKEPLHPHQPGVLFNGMIAPLLNYKIKGAIWYQGESNAVGKRSELYELVFPGMIENWRARWGYDFPFYFVQLAPYNYAIEYSGSLLRESQLSSLRTPKTGMAVTMDIGNPNDIHPRNKQDVGKRLALWALAKDYGKDIVFSGPLYKSYQIDGKNMIISFDYAESGLEVDGNEIDNLLIAGKDKVFRSAKYKIDGGKLIVFHPEISLPSAVRLAFKNTDEVNLFNMEGLPASSFRTDDWKLNTTQVSYEPTYTDGWDKVSVKLTAPEAGQIYYTIDGSDPSSGSLKYAEPFELEKSATVKAIYINEDKSPGPIASFDLNIHELMGKPVMLMQPYSQKYTAGGNLGLVDGVRGSLNYNDGRWQGFEGTDLRAVINLGEVKDLNTLNLSFLRAINGWIFLPSEVTVWGSKDGVSFEKIKTWKMNDPKPDDPTEVYNLNHKFEGSYKFIKVEALNDSPLPEWHPGKGGKAWIFIDEIEAY